MKLTPFFLLLALTLSSCAPVEPTPVEPTPVPVDGPDSEEDIGALLQIGLIALEDGGSSGPLVGCGDSLVLVTQISEEVLNPEEQIEAALEALFAIDGSSYGESGLYNALSPSDVTVDSVHLEDGELEVQLSGSLLSGGTCDDPRIMEQIKETAKSNSGIGTELEMSILVNGITLEEHFNAKGE